MKKRNDAPSSTERFVQAQYINQDGTIEVYSSYMVSDHGMVASNRYVNDRDKILFSSVIRSCNMILDTGNFDQNHFYMDLRSTTYGELYNLGNRGQDLAMG